LSGQFPQHEPLPVAAFFWFEPASALTKPNEMTAITINRRCFISFLLLSYKSFPRAHAAPRPSLAKGLSARRRIRRTIGTRQECVVLKKENGAVAFGEDERRGGGGVDERKR
jgi:hypothetical protein